MLALKRTLPGRVLIGVDVGMGVSCGFWKLVLAGPVDPARKAARLQI